MLAAIHTQKIHAQRSSIFLLLLSEYPQESSAIATCKILKEIQKVKKFPSFIYSEASACEALLGTKTESRVECVPELWWELRTPTQRPVGHIALGRCCQGVLGGMLRPWCPGLI